MKIFFTFKKITTNVGLWKLWGSDSRTLATPATLKPCLGLMYSRYEIRDYVHRETLGRISSGARDHGIRITAKHVSHSISVYVHFDRRQLDTMSTPPFPPTLIYRAPFGGEVLQTVLS